MKGAELQFAQFVEGLLDAGVQVGGGQYPYPPREKCAIYVQPKGSLEVRIETRTGLRHADSSTLRVCWLSHTQPI